MHLKSIIFSYIDFFWRSNALPQPAVPTAGQSATLPQGLIAGSVFDLLCTRTPQILFFPAGGPLGVCWYIGLFLPRFKVCISHCWTWDLLAHFSSLLKSFFMGRTIIWFINYSSEYCIICWFSCLSSSFSAASIRFKKNVFWLIG